MDRAWLLNREAEVLAKGTFGRNVVIDFVKLLPKHAARKTCNTTSPKFQGLTVRLLPNTLLKSRGAVKVGICNTTSPEPSSLEQKKKLGVCRYWVRTR